VRFGRIVIAVAVLVVGGALPWLASFASLKFLQNWPGVPLLLGQTLVMPAMALAPWWATGYVWPGRSRSRALLLGLGLWFVPTIWLALSDVGRPGSDLRMTLPTMLAGGPMILSVYMLNSLGLAAAFVVLGVAAFWRQREVPSGA
jgi:hypothetical protein